MNDWINNNKEIYDKIYTTIDFTLNTRINDLRGWYANYSDYDTLFNKCALEN